jgi:Ca-activated chloride channel family protein
MTRCEPRKKLVPLSPTRPFSTKSHPIESRISFVPLVFSLLFCLSACNVGTTAWAQSQAPRHGNNDTPGQPVRLRESVHVDVNLALVHVSVTDLHNRPIPGLEPDNFRVFEDNIEQEVVNFSSEDVPVSLGVIFDLSGSMAKNLRYAKEAAAQFFKTANSQDEGFLIGFGTHAELFSPFTGNIEDLQNRLAMRPAGGSTALLDGVYLGISEMRSARNAKHAIVIISDGGENHSRYSEEDLKRLLREADTQLYAIGIFESSAYRHRTLTELNGPLLLTELTELTGGRAFTVRNPNELSEIATKIGTELHAEYILGYHPSNKTHDARWRKITVKLRSPNGLPRLSVHAKRGYYAPVL